MWETVVGVQPHGCFCMFWWWFQTTLRTFVDEHANESRSEPRVFPIAMYDMHEALRCQTQAVILMCMHASLLACVRQSDFSACSGNGIESFFMCLHQHFQSALLWSRAKQNLVTKCSRFLVLCHTGQSRTPVRPAPRLLIVPLVHAQAIIRILLPGHNHPLR